jgi:hypothetical protein
MAVPVFLFSYAKMIALAFEAWSTWAIIASVVAHVIVICSLAMLHDHQSERR